MKRYWLFVNDLLVDSFDSSFAACVHFRDSGIEGMAEVVDSKRDKVTEIMSNFEGLQTCITAPRKPGEEL